MDAREAPKFAASEEALGHTLSLKSTAAGSRKAAVVRTIGHRLSQQRSKTMNNTANIWGTKVEQGLTETVALYVAFSSVAGVQGIESAVAEEKQFAGEGMSNDEWASL